MQYGLIGEKLGHSFSKQIHAKLGDYPYDLKELAPYALPAFLQARDFCGVNVTIPYKKAVLPFCDRVDNRAARIGAANTLVLRAGCLTAYNTDYDGVVYTLAKHGFEISGRTVLLLGTGGTSATMRAVAEDLGASRVLVASRSKSAEHLTYAEAEARKEVEVILNCSPAGMYPNNGEKLLSLQAFPKLEAVMDAVYNPYKTALLLEAEALGVKAVNGLEMLVAQAAAASALFLNKPMDTDIIGKVYLELKNSLCNVSLVGMPGCGKTSLGKALAKKLDKDFIDLDLEVEGDTGMTIPEFFASRGEAAFREMESKAVRKAGAKQGLVISTGGGVVLKPENINALRQNGPVVFIDCPVERLSISDGRPLAKDREELKQLHKKREQLYRTAADEVSIYHPYFKENLLRLITAVETAIEKF